MINKLIKAISIVSVLAVVLSVMPSAFAEAAYMKYDFYYSPSGDIMRDRMIEEAKIRSEGAEENLPEGGSRYIYEVAESADLTDCGTFSDTETPYRLFKYLVDENNFPVYAKEECTLFGGSYEIKKGDIVFLQNENKYPFACAIVTETDTNKVTLSGTDGESSCKYTVENTDTSQMFRIVKIYYPSAEEIVFTYLKDSMAYSNEVCSGILSNIFAESGFDSRAREATGKRGFGLCQWTGNREENLLNWCKDNGLDANHIIPQLMFLKHELTEGDFIYVDNMLRTVSRDGNGAYDAAHAFCYFFEQPENYEDLAELRGENAEELFYPIVVGFAG